MSSIKEKMKSLPVISIESDEQFVVEIKHNGVLMAQAIVSVHELEHNATNGTSKFTLSGINPCGHGDFSTTTISTDEYPKDS